VKDAFKQSRQAMVIWKMTEYGRQKAWDSVLNEQDVLDCQQDDEAARLEVATAFHEDTKHVNNWDKCKLVSVLDVQRMIDRWDERHQHELDS
jgi:hypothetical protein